MFQLVSVVRHPLVDYGCASPYTSVFLLESTRTGFDAEVRAAWKAQAPDAPFEPAEEPTTITVRCSRMYLRKPWTKLPVVPGVYDLVLDWRTIGGVWHRAPARFPVTFEERIG